MREHRTIHLNTANGEKENQSTKRRSTSNEFIPNCAHSTRLEAETQHVLNVARTSETWSEPTTSRRGL